MENTKLIIKYKDKYLCDNKNGEINFIEIPSYQSRGDFHNIDVFVSLLCSKNLDDDYEASRGLSYEEGLEVFSSFEPDCILEIDFNTYIYDLDEELLYRPQEYLNQCEVILEKLPGNLLLESYDELLRKTEEQTVTKKEENISEDTPFFFRRKEKSINKELLKTLENLNYQRKENDVLLLYSGGKDSTLAAIRLKNDGYNVHFIHFDNGAMLDTDKPYLTFKNTFADHKGYYFDYQNHSVNIERSFKDYFNCWKEEHGNVLKDETLDSEVRCLSCRLAMYTEAIKYAKEHGFKYIAEGARISQKFMIEQPLMIEQLQNLATNYGIEVLYPVLDLEDDFLEKEELIENGFSSRSWESKCLLGRRAKEKNDEDEKIIIDYYEEKIKPKVFKKI